MTNFNSHMMTLLLLSPPDVGPPRLRESGTTYYEVPLGERCKLRCPVLPPAARSARVDWFRGGEVVLPGERVRVGRSSLTLLNVTEGDGGLYYCRASNEHGEVYNNFTVRVVGEYAPLHLHSLVLYLHCHVPHCPMSLYVLFSICIFPQCTLLYMYTMYTRLYVHYVDCHVHVHFAIYTH